MSNELALSPASIDTEAFFKPDQVDLIKRQIAKNVTHDELSLFLYQCARTGLDPLSRQIYAISRQEWDNDKRCKVQKMSIQTGIDGLRLIADRTGRYSPGPDNEYEYDGDKRLVKATATVLKRTADGTWHPVRASAFFEEYAQFKDGHPTKMWKEKPHIMLGKCAEALALRKAFPAEMSGIYTSDEMGQTEEAPTYIPPKEDARPKASISTTTSTVPAPSAGGPTTPASAVMTTSATDPKGAAPPPSHLHVVTAESGESGPASSTSEADEETGEVDAELVDCFKLVEEGHRKNNTYRCEWVPAGRRTRHTPQQRERLEKGLEELGIEVEDHKSSLRNKYGKETIDDLSVDEADDYLDHLRSRWNKRKYKHPRDKAAAKELRAAPENMAPEMEAALREPGSDDE